MLAFLTLGLQWWDLGGNWIIRAKLKMAIPGDSLLIQFSAEHTCIASFNSSTVGSEFYLFYFIIFIIYVSLSQGLKLEPKLAWNFLCNLSWSQTHSNSPASANLPGHHCIQLHFHFKEILKQKMNCPRPLIWKIADLEFKLGSVSRSLSKASHSAELVLLWSTKTLP